MNDNDDGRVVMRGADGNGGSIRLRFDRQLRFAVALIRSVRELGRQNVRRFIGRALLNGGGIVRFDWGKRLLTLGIGSRF